MSRRGDTPGDARRRMVEEQIAGRGLRDEAVLAALRAVPRHSFVPAGMEGEAYLDGPLPIGFGQTISQPYMVALMTALLGADARSRVLEVGAGSGYQTAVLAELVAQVWAVERVAELAEAARRRLRELGYDNVHLAVGDGTLGWEEHAPYDGILVAAAAEDVPAALLDQLVVGGRLVIPLGVPHRDQVLTVYRRGREGFDVERHTPCRFVPLVSGGVEGAEDVAENEMTGLGTAGAQEGGAGTRAVKMRLSGRVQGVYYRASTQREARRLGVAGYAKNLRDGSVEVWAQGDAAAVDALVAWCRGGPPRAEVARLEAEDVEPDAGMDTFEVR
ncbi:MAG TPA: protein-L-isoaspartate(D-aspartate) O-methyltransferase [Thermoleophilia bacterium]|nr:protein-L-isoaspartate(D-aspartate) O-methyltransferase [Thermoleophilia bacterium]